MLDLIPNKDTSLDDDDASAASIDPTRRVSRVASDVARGNAPLLVIAGELKEMVPPFDFVYAESEPSKTALRAMIVSWLHQGYLVLAISDVKTFSMFERIAEILKSRIYIVAGLPLLENDPVLRSVASGYDAVSYLELPTILTLAKPAGKSAGKTEFESLQDEMRKSAFLAKKDDATGPTVEQTSGTQVRF